MAYTVDAEDVAIEVLKILKTNMVAQLDLVEAAKTSVALTLEDIERYYFGDKLDPPPVLPSIVVKIRSYKPSAQAMNKRYRDDPIKLEIECYIAYDINQSATIDGQEHDFEEILEMKIARYSRAIVEVLAADNTLSEKATLMEISDVLLSDALPNNDEILKACRINVEYKGVPQTL